MSSLRKRANGSGGRPNNYDSIIAYPSCLKKDMLAFATLIIARNIETVNGIRLFVTEVLEIHISIIMQEVTILCRKRKPQRIKSLQIPAGTGISSTVT